VTMVTMARTPSVIPGIQPVDLPDSRQSIQPLHNYLRECILNGVMPPGTKLSQVALAEQLGVSRTPLREVLRMLQEEGLVEIEPNQRTRVAGLDAQELDHVYASRILLETLALSMTLGGFGAKDRREAQQMLTAMRRAARSGDTDGWFQAHATYHRILTSGGGESLQKQLVALAERSIRYIRIYQMAEPGSWQAAGDLEHAAILTAISDRDDFAALSGLAQHLARTALRVMSDCAPDYVPVAVPHALDLVEHRRPVPGQPATAG
jgi:DNA-binding GntR family transcriptional regulator